MPPNRGPAPVKLYRKDDAEVLTLGPITCYVFEDGSHTDNRVGAVLLMIPPGVSGPPMHWHRFHDELFFVTKGTVRFIVPVSPGDLMVVPPRAIHNFENASKTEEAELYMTATPGYYIDYFRMLAQGTEDDVKLDEADQAYLMAQFGTFPPDIPSEP
ncbi:hypothetical protein INS49_009770 [Diaporthe citri]|uniref:uncharacterized protein n=1 Tax=Diaporthe citri TaxID=83186 RepID=UPI001C7ECF04|nr:uncharacterized protein INS49_009770 [Diaporthe citri]KAG6361543.1 hypothetical protein INS49_009770 [Diaporthe citri]